MPASTSRSQGPTRRWRAPIALRHALALAALLATTSTWGDAPDGGAGASRAPEAQTVAGTIAGYDAGARSLSLDADGARIALQVDRNTAVFLEDRLGSVADLAPGLLARACFGRDHVAAWVEVRRRKPPPPPQEEAQGSGLPVLPGFQEQRDAGAGSAEAGTPAPGGGEGARPSPGVVPEPRPPEGEPGSRPPQVPPPGPAGPSEVPRVP